MPGGYAGHHDMNKKTIRIEVTEEENVFLLYTPDGGKPSKFHLTRKKPVFNSYRKQAWAWQIVMNWKATNLQKERPTSLKKLLKDGYLVSEVDSEKVEKNVQAWENWARYEKLLKTEVTEININHGTYVIVDPCYLVQKPELVTEWSEIYWAAELVGGGAHWRMLEGDGRYSVYASGTEAGAGLVGVDSGTMVALPADKFELREDCKEAAYTVLHDVQKVIIGNKRVILVCSNDDYIIKM